MNLSVLIAYARLAHQVIVPACGSGPSSNNGYDVDLACATPVSEYDQRLRSLLCDGSSDGCPDHANKDGNRGKVAETRICRGALFRYGTHLNGPELADV